MLRKEVLMAKAIVRPEQQFIPVRLVKPESRTVYMNKGTKLGELEVLNETGGYYENVLMMTDKELQDTPTSHKRVVEINKEIRIGELPSDVKEKLCHVLEEYQDVFSSSKMDIGCTSLIHHNIDTGDSPPIAVAPRRIPIALEEKVDKMIADLLKNDIIQPSESPWNAPIVIVAKERRHSSLCRLQEIKCCNEENSVSYSSDKSVIRLSQWVYLLQHTGFVTRIPPNSYGTPRRSKDCIRNSKRAI